MSAFKNRSLAVLAACSALVGVAFGQKADEKKPAAVTPAQQGQPEMSPEEMAWMQAAMPGPNHELLKSFAGKWTVSNKMWEGEGEPQLSTGTAEVVALLDGRFYRESYKSEFMGMPFEGIGHTGYDNIGKKFISTWMDNMSTGVMSSEGTFDAATKTFAFSGEFSDPMGKKIKNRMTTKLVSNDEHVMTMFHTEPGGTEKKVMEIVYKRAAQSAAAPAKEKSGS